MFYGVERCTWEDIADGSLNLEDAPRTIKDISLPRMLLLDPHILVPFPAKTPNPRRDLLPFPFRLRQMIRSMPGDPDCVHCCKDQCATECETFYLWDIEDDQALSVRSLIVSFGLRLRPMLRDRCVTHHIGESGLDEDGVTSELRSYLADILLPRKPSFIEDAVIEEDCIGKTLLRKTV